MGTEEGRKDGGADETEEYDEIATGGGKAVTIGDGGGGKDEEDTETGGGECEKEDH